MGLLFIELRLGLDLLTVEFLFLLCKEEAIKGVVLYIYHLCTNFCVFRTAERYGPNFLF
jgi:hypothetical protein